jgi:hypothetical protein
MEDEPSAEGWDRAEGAEDQVSAPHHDLDAGTERQPGRIAPHGGGSVPPAELVPDLGTLRHVAPDRVVGHVEHLPQQTSRLRPQPMHPPLSTVREGNHADPVKWGQEDLRVEAGEDPVVLEREVAANLGAEESEAETRDARIGLKLGCQHLRERLRLKHGAVLVPAAAEEGGDVSSHVFCT